MSALVRLLDQRSESLILSTVSKALAALDPALAGNGIGHVLRAGLIGLARFDIFERPAHRQAAAHWRSDDVVAGLRSGSTPRKNGSSARVLTMTATADLIRATVNNRINNPVASASVANHRRRRSDRSRAALPTVVCRGANSRSAPVTSPSLRRQCVGSQGGPGVGDLFAA